MNRLETVLPEWTRVMWTTPGAREAWDETIHNIVGAWLRLERWTVIDGARDSCLTFCEPHNLPELVRWATTYGVLALPVAQVGVSDQYSATPLPIAPDRPWQYRVVLCRPEHSGAWLAAWKDGETDNDAIGKLLGFPECCRRFFQKIWVDEKYLDTTWPMAIQSKCTNGIGDMGVRIAGADACNILWRWMGVRAVAHLPCSFDCKPTVDVAKMFRAVGDKREFSKWLDFTDEILSWPVEWSALHGIAEIKTPILKVSSRTDMTAEKYVVQREGSSYPKEGASGISFPYENRQKVQVTKTPAFARAFETKPSNANGADLWRDNGFTTRAAMDAAHSVLLEVVPEELEVGGVVLDLGCGNGRLLERLGAKVPGLNLYGIEGVSERCRRAGERFRNNGKQILVYEGSLFDSSMWTEEYYDLVFFMPGRVLELNGKRRYRSREKIQNLLTRAGLVVFYAYGDWLKKHDNDIVHLLEKAGFGEWRLGKCGRAENVQAVQAKRPIKKGGWDA